MPKTISLILLIFLTDIIRTAISFHDDMTHSYWIYIIAAVILSVVTIGRKSLKRKLAGHKRSHSWTNMGALIGLNILDLVLGLTLFPDSNKAWIIMIMMMILCEIYLIYFYEVQKRKNFERQFEL
jgi:hypothetical protein